MVQWLDEIDLDPSDPPVRMGVRTLGDRSWLLRDDEEESQLELKANLVKDKSSEVFLSLPESEAAGLEVCSLITDTGFSVVRASQMAQNWFKCAPRKKKRADKAPRKSK